MSPEDIRALANELASPSNQFLNWLVIGLICLVSGFIHFFVAWLKKSGEIQATSQRLDQVVEQTRAIAKAQEKIRQNMADSIWRDQRRWELEFELHENLVISLGESRMIYTALRTPEIHRDHAERVPEIYSQDLQLMEQRRTLIQRASLLMPADIFNGFRDALSLNHVTDQDSESVEALCEKFRLAEDAFATAENFVREHARKRLGVT